MANKKIKQHISTLRRNAYGYLFVMPFIIGLAFLFVPAIIESLIFSFHEVTPLAAEGGVMMRFVSWENYNTALNVDVVFLELLIFVLIQVSTNVPIILIFSFLVAMLLNQSFRGRGFIRMIFFIPVIAATGIVAHVQMNNDLLTMYSATGISSGGQSGALSADALDISALIGFFRSLGIGGAVIDYVILAIDRLYFIILSSGVQIIVFLSALQAVPVSLYEASRVEGCSGWESFWKITLPIVSPIVLVNAVYTIIDSFLDVRNGLTELIYDTVFRTVMFGYGAAMTWIYFVTALTVLGVITFIISRLVVYYD